MNWILKSKWINISKISKIITHFLFLKNIRIILRTLRSIKMNLWYLNLYNSNTILEKYLLRSIEIFTEGLRISCSKNLSFHVKMCLLALFQILKTMKVSKLSTKFQFLRKINKNLLHQMKKSQKLIKTLILKKLQ